jgi:hypothetical protein
MSQNMDATCGKRRVHAPMTCMPDGSSPVLSILLEEDEEVRWQWTHYANGQSVVSGYEVIKKKEEKEAFDIKQAISDWLWEGNEGKKG